MPQTAQRWGIVGGGFLGMTLAHRLARQGQAVTLFEAAPALGGLASAWSLGDVVWDRHYHVTLLSDAYLRALLTELGLEKEMAWVETQTVFYLYATLYSMSNTIEYLRFPPLSLFSKLRLGATIFYASRIRNWKKQEKIPVADWLRRWSGRATFEKIWRPLLRAKLGDNYVKASAAFIWAIIARMYAARRTGLKKEMFGYVPGGYARTLERYAERLASEGVRIELRRAATKVEPNAVDGVAITFADGTRRAVDQVVVTLAALERLYPHFRRDDVVCFRVSRVKYVLAISTLNYSDRLPPMTTSIPGLHIVNSAHIVNGTLNVNETIQLAEKAAARLLSSVRAASVASEDEQLVARA